MCPDLPDTWMWQRAQELLEEADRLQKRFFQLGSGTRPTWEPPADVFSTKRGLRVLVALPGVSSARLEVTLVGRTLLVSGVRALPSELREAKVERIEIPHGRFERRFELPQGEHELGETVFEDGCLSVEVLRR